MRSMTVLFEDEDLYIAVKVEAARRNRPLKDLVTEALREWLEDHEDADLLPVVDAARAERAGEGGIEAAGFFRKLEDEDRSGPGGL